MTREKDLIRIREERDSAIKFSERLMERNKELVKEIEELSTEIRKLKEQTK